MVAADTPLARQPRVHSLSRPPGLAALVDVQQSVGGGRLGHIAEQFGEVPFVFRPRDAEAGLGHEVAERQRVRQLICPAGQHRRDLLQHLLSSGVVQHHVMDLQ
jgi:hypothetical protein